MIQIKRNLILSLEKRKKHGELITKNVPIRLRVTYQGIRVDVQTGYRIDMSKWNQEKGIVINGTSNKLQQTSSTINARLSEMKMKISDLFTKFEIIDQIPSKEDLKKAIKDLKSKGKDKRKSKIPNDFYSTYDQFVIQNSRLNSWSSATISKFSTIKSHLYKFKEDLTFEYLDQQGLTDFLIHLRINANLKNSTIKKQLGFVKWFLRWSYENGYHTNEHFKTFRPKIKDSTKKVIFLTEEEKNKILSYQIPETKKYLERVRDILFFTCYTGCRYSDVYNLKRSNIKEGHIELVTIKTSDTLIIELNKHSKAILAKYEDIPYKEDKALPVISNQKMNDYLKELGELAEINSPISQTHYVGNKRFDEVLPKYELLGTHVGRRTFICSALSIGIPIQIVMKWTGHSDYKSMKPYIDIADKTKKNAMKKFNSL